MEINEISEQLSVFGQDKPLPREALACWACFTRDGSPKPTVAEITSWKVGRNDPCPCGSGKKFKKCCLKTPEDREAQSKRYARHGIMTPGEFDEKYHVHYDCARWLEPLPELPDNEDPRRSEVRAFLHS